MANPDDNEPPFELSDDEPSELELAEAAALARALERGTSGEHPPPEDALEAAALLRVATEPALEQRRRAAIWDELEAELERRQEVRPAGTNEGLLRWLWTLVPLAGVAAVVFYMSRGGDEAPASSAQLAVELPVPSRDLLEAQARLLNAPSQAERAAFEEEMGQYRQQVYASLEARYR